MRRKNISNNNFRINRKMTNKGYKNVYGYNPNSSIVRKGNTGEDVEKIQSYLVKAAKIYQELPVVVEDGIYDDSTENAVKCFQRLNFLHETGYVDRFTLNKLRYVANTDISGMYRKYKNEPYNKSDNIIKEGSVGKYVLALQKYINQLALKYAVIHKLKEDGIFGPKTKNSVLEMQHLFKLDEDGIVGDITWNTLYNAITGKSINDEMSD